jgi:nicotinate-nucleotide adenylyltransferase
LRIGVFGGTFDPIHLGHLAVAEGALQHLSLDSVMFIPAGRPWMKEGVYLAEGEHRLAMVQLAVEGLPGFSTSDMEMRREGLTYTVDTLREMDHASQGTNEVYLILGADAYSSFELWKEPAEILSLSTLAVASRPGGPEPGFEKLDGLLVGSTAGALALPVEQLDISGSDIRDRVCRGFPLDGYVPQTVERYIHEHGLYSGVGRTM